MKPSDAEQIIAPYRERLNEAIRTADRTLEERFGRERHRLRRRTLSNIRNDFVCEEARKIFANDPSIYFETRSGRDLMHIRDKAVIVFKKIDGRRLRTYNWPTQLVMRLFGQRQMIDMPATPRFVAGWRLDRLGIAVQATLLTYPRGREAEWAIPLDEAASTPVSVIKRPGVRPDTETVAPRVRAKKQPGQGDGQEHKHA
jgi:hypothetical protein